MGFLPDWLQQIADTAPEGEAEINLDRSNSMYQVIIKGSNGNAIMRKGMSSHRDTAAELFAHMRDTHPGAFTIELVDTHNNEVLKSQKGTKA